MPVKIAIGPPVLTINQGSTFMVTDLDGQMTAERDGAIAADGELGVFADDTRFVSHYALFADGQRWIRLSSATPTYYAARIYLTNPPLTTERGDIPASTLTLIVNRSIAGGVHEDLDVTNHGLTVAHFNLEIALRADFADLFEVKSHSFVRRGRIATTWDEERSELRTSYARREFRRSIIYRLLRCGSRPRYANGRITFELALKPGATWHSCCYYLLVRGQRIRAPKYGCRLHETREPEVEQLQRRWRDDATALTSSNEDVVRLYRQSVEDMGALRLYEHDFAPDVWVPAAGVPWFVAIFGRDSLIASLQTMLVHAGFSRGTLKKLAQLQATEVDDYRDAQPGKIPHELRRGELAFFNEIPHTPYYGTADATPLYLITLHETWKWLGDTQLLREYRDVALRCLEWIDRSGDFDGDGFQEYQTRSPRGYENMGWKDAGDAVVYPDGSQVKQPKALVELQGYVFDAWLRMAEVFDALGEPARALELRRKAAELQQRFEERFWCEDEGFYAFGLGPDKQPIKTIASNAGQCLWSGIASPAHAARVVKRLFQPDMWSGWGIRTLSARNPAYNPISYQRGSVWPHDNGLIALGLKRYGFSAEVARVARAITDAASSFLSYRLPELYAGIERQPDAFPVQYLGANVPQAWAAGTVFHLLHALLGLRADAPNGRLLVDPDLPDWLPDVTLRNLRVGSARLTLRAWREETCTRWESSIQAGDLDVRQESWQAAAAAVSQNTATGGRHLA